MRGMGIVYDGTQGITTGQQSLTWHPRITAVQKPHAILLSFPFPVTYDDNVGSPQFIYIFLILLNGKGFICFILYFISFSSQSNEKIFLKNLDKVKHIICKNNAKVGHFFVTFTMDHRKKLCILFFFAMTECKCIMYQRSYMR